MIEEGRERGIKCGGGRDVMMEEGRERERERHKMW